MGIFIILAVLLVVAAAAIVTVIVVVLQRNRRKESAASSRYQDFLRRREYASHGTALVVRAEGGMAGEGATQARVHLTLEVTLPGGKTYRTQTAWLVQLMALDNLRQGSTVAVRIDMQDKNIIYPADEYARYIPE